MIDPLQDQILEQYVLGQLDKATRQEVNRRIKIDSDFAQQYIIVRDIIWSVEFMGRAKLKALLNEVETELEIDGFFLTEEDIDVYVLHEELGKEQERLENRQKLDLEFAHRVVMHADVVKGIYIAGEEQLRTDLNTIAQELTKEGYFKKHERIIVPPKIWMLVVASLLSLLVMVPLFFQYEKQNSSLAELTSFRAFENQLDESVRLILPEMNRAGKTESLQGLQRGIGAYELRDYVQAAQFFEEYLNNELNQYYREEVQFYLAVSYLGQAEHKVAVTLLESLTQKPYFKWQADAQWYLGLAYYKNGNRDRATVLFDALKQDKKYGEKTKKILEALK